MKTIIIKARLRALVLDQLRRYAEYAEYHWPNRNAYLCIKSGNDTNSKIIYQLRKAGIQISDIRSTTNAETILTAYREAFAAGKDYLFIFTTYDSAARIRDAGISSDLEINDEAHNLCTQEFSDSDIFCVGGGKVLSMTATPEESENLDYSMRHQKFGPWLTRDSATAIKQGKIACPLLHFMPRKEKTGGHNSNVSAILDGFECHKKRLKERSINPNRIGAKLLVAMPSILDVQEAVANFEIRELSRNGVVICAIDSENGAWIDGIAYPPNKAKEAVLDKLRTLKDGQDAIVIQIAMLTEGIDVSGFTGCMLLRGLSERNLIQFAGRTLRLLPADRQQIDGGKIPRSIAIGETTDRHRRVKPYGHIIIPIFDTSDIHNLSLVSMLVRRFRDEFGFIPTEEQLLIDTFNTPGEIEQRVRDELKAEWHHILEDEINDISCIWAMKLAQNYPSDFIQPVFEDLGLKYKAEDLQITIEAGGLDELDEMVKKLRKSGQGVFANEIKKKFGTIYTPDFVVEQTIDLALKHLDKSLDWTELTYCDPAAGDGNFLAILHHKLMENEQFIARFSDPIDRSHHILTKNLWGYEILHNMYLACKLRLILIHAEICKQHGSDYSNCDGLVDKLNIYHGNTILTPEDVLPWEWIDKKTGEEYVSPNEKIGEGGLLPEELQNRKFDVIVGNPPYTHLRNIGNRRYAAYPKQRDMAQVFVRWSLDHLTDNGICSLNTTDTWLDAKVSDGAKEIRAKIEGRLREVHQDENTQTYSAGDGGDVSTMICVISRQLGPQELIVNSEVHQYTAGEMQSPGFLQIIYNRALQYPFQAAPIVQYAPKLNGGRSINRQDRSSQFYKNWLSNVFFDFGGGDCHLMIKCRLVNNPNKGLDGFLGSVKLVRCNSPKAIIDTQFESEIKNVLVAYKYGLWLLGYLNTACSFGFIDSYTRKTARPNGGYIYELSNNLWPLCQVPDYDWYKEHRPQQHAAFLKWVEDNMRDKDAFLAGIDEQFEKLIK